MGTSEGVDGGIVGDCSVGTIVWVRRRNGSWWPGRILGPSELSASHLMSPRSGTPVKLLGREDASVDWYNLEKSKRVKAFRCGEFDACIERAEASQGVPIKKREKYARREDAILHALELEEQQLERKQQKLGIVSNSMGNKSTGAFKREVNNCSPSEIYLRNDESGGHGKFVNHKSQTLSKRVPLPLEGNMSDSVYARKGKNGKQLSWEEDIPEAIPRMRGLQDFGLRIAPSKRKFPQSVAWEGSRRPVDNHVDVLYGAGHMMGGVNHVGSIKNSLSTKKKRSQGGMIEESLVKRRDRRRPLVQVLQSSAKLQVSHSLQSDQDAIAIPMQGGKDDMSVTCRAKRSRYIYLPADSTDSLDHLGYPSDQMQITATHFGIDDCLHDSDSTAEENTYSGLIEANESESSEGDYLEPDMEEVTNLPTDATQTLVPGSKNSERHTRCNSSAFYVPEKFGIINNDEIPLPSYIPQLNPHEQSADASAEGGVSKWHMKGKRNVRNLSKKAMAGIEGKISVTADRCNGSVKGTTFENKGSILKMGRIEPSSQRISGREFYNKREELNYDYDEGDLPGKDLGQPQLIGFEDRRYPLNVKAAKDRGRSNNSFNDSYHDSHVISPSGWEADGPTHVARRAYWEGSNECFDPVYAGHMSDEMEPTLVDVDLKVQASYQGEHVPLVSLMSRLNGKAIIGHPVHIEILGDGSTDLHVSRNDAGVDESTAPPSVWRTARRTVMQRVRRSHPAPSALEGEEADALQHSDFECKPPLKKAYAVHFDHQARLAKKSISHAHRSVSGKFQRKPLKKVSLSSQKTRTLSSIATEHKLGGEGADAKHATGGGILDGLIKQEGAAPLVTCVPVKVVFSRILEAVGRPSSAAAHRVLLTSSTVKDPS